MGRFYAHTSNYQVTDYRKTSTFYNFASVTVPAPLLIPHNSTMLATSEGRDRLAARVRPGAMARPDRDIKNYAIYFSLRKAA
jgi:hypothetical protein